MSAAPEIHEDGALPLALNLLEDAMHALCGPRSQIVEGRVIYSPSRYLQLRDALMGEQVNTGGGGGSKSRPPMWTDAFDLLNEIDVAVEVWQPAFTGVPPTVGRLHWLQQRKWRPQDVRQITQITQAVAEWAASIDALLDPPRKWTLPNPCPACNTAIVQRRDGAGENVRQPALHLDPTGCTCLRCKAHWPPEQFVFLSRVLGSLPDNIDPN